MGTRFIVKNNFELKNAERVLFEGNVLENSWGGFSQTGFQILLTPKSQESKCPQCIVENITIRNCVLRYSAGGIQMATGASDSGGFAQGLGNVSIHDVLIAHIDGDRYEGHGFVFQMSRSLPFYRNLKIDHVTGLSGARGLLILGGPPERPAENITIVNSMFDVGQSEVISTGGRNNCAFGMRTPRDFLDSCWKPYTFSNNVLISASGGWPKGNFSVKSAKAAGVVVGSGSSLGGYRLLPESEFRGRGKDAKDIGADMGAIQVATEGVAQ